jgi:hypothetical protein
VLRILQITLSALGLIAVALPFSLPAAPRQPGRELFYIARATPWDFVLVGGILWGVVILLTAAAIPLKHHWSDDLRGWIK